MNEADSGTRRLFFALWPNPEVRRQLAKVSHSRTRHPVADANLHMTLLFLGGRTARELDCFCEAAGNLQGEAFELQLDYLGAGQGRASSGWGPVAYRRRCSSWLTRCNRVWRPVG